MDGFTVTLIETGIYRVYQYTSAWEPSRHVANIHGEERATQLVETLNRRSGAEWDEEYQEWDGVHYGCEQIVLNDERFDSIAIREGLHPGLDDNRLTRWRKVTVWDTQEPLRGAFPPPGTPTVTLYQADCARCGETFDGAGYWGPQKSASGHWKQDECNRRARERRSAT